MTTSNITHAVLKARQRAERANHPPDLALRVHRALSWLDRAEREDRDADARFIFLWIAFNAAYATDIAEEYRGSEQGMFRVFLQKLFDLDKQKLLADLVWQEFPGSIRALLASKFVFGDFWKSQNGSLAKDEWEGRFAAANAHAKRALAQGDTVAVLSIVLARIYTLRNQVMHGGATWNGSVNREQIRDCTAFMAKLVPVIIVLMLDNPRTLWGSAVYPVVEA
jgi:hypothetical protein